eukprot:s249_g15.t1
MLEDFSFDKTCQRWANRVREESSSTSERAKHTSEYLSFEVAKEEGLSIDNPEQKKILDGILAGLPQDHDWDMDEPRQAALGKAGEIRYKYMRRRQDEFVDETQSKEAIQAGGSFRKKDNPFLKDAPAAATIKEENPDYGKFQSSLASLRSKRYDAQEAVEEEKSLEFKEKVKMCQDMQQEIRQEGSALDAVRLSEYEKDQKKWDDSLIAALVKVEANSEGIASFLKRSKKWIK